MKIKRIILITALVCMANQNLKLNNPENVNIVKDANIAVEVFNENAVDLQLNAKSAYLIDFENQKQM